jgi:hypothetical protein
VFPAVLIVPLIVLVHAFAEEIRWRGYAVPRSLTAMEPMRARAGIAVNSAGFVSCVPELSRKRLLPHADIAAFAPRR